jgi:RHS repeat-associated protein
LAKTDARGITTSFAYDTLNRLTQKSFSNGEAPELFYYDYYPGWAGGAASGRLVKADKNGGHYFQYDALGRIVATQQCLPSDCNAGASVGAAYDLAGNLTQLTYPDQEKVNYAQDAAGRTVSAVDSVNNINYVTGAAYGPTGALTDSVYGKAGGFTGIVNSFSYNSRLQPATLWSSSPVRTLMYLTYDYHLGAGDNGNVYGIANQRDATRNQSFTYDSLNRLISAQNAGTDCNVTLPDGNTMYWANSYGYDAWGNMVSKTPTKCSAESLSVTALPNNRLSNYTYDAAGNLTRDPAGNHNYAYNAASQVTQVDGGAAAYSYDAEGNRLRKDVAGSPSTEYVYLNGQTIAEKNVATGGWTNYVFLNGDRVARRDPDGAVEYYFSDHLKTAAVITDATGTVLNESDYYPWGGELRLTGNDSNRYKFTGQEFDAETGLYDYGARHYSSPLGRFMTPDEPFVDQNPSDPQSWNIYTYVRNNPLRYADPTGNGCTSDGKGGPGIDDDGPGESCRQVAENDAKFLQEHGPNVTVEGGQGGAGSGVAKEAANSARDMLNQAAPGFDWALNHVGIHRFESNNATEEKAMQVTSWAVLLVPVGGEEAAESKVANKLTAELHHLLPKQFATFFEKLGLDIEKHKIPLGKTEHRLLPDGLHTGPSNWNKLWGEWIATHPNATRSAVLQHLVRMMWDRGLLK